MNNCHNNINYNSGADSHNIMICMYHTFFMAECNCSSSEVCSRTLEGGFQCVCRVGYSLDEDSDTCAGIIIGVIELFRGEDPIPPSPLPTGSFLL